MAATQMQAMVLDAPHGGLQRRTVPRPEPAADQALVKVAQD